MTETSSALSRLAHAIISQDTVPPIDALQVNKAEGSGCICHAESSWRSELGWRSNPRHEPLRVSLNHFKTECQKAKCPDMSKYRYGSGIKREKVELKAMEPNRGKMKQELRKKPLNHVRVCVCDISSRKSQSTVLLVHNRLVCGDCLLKFKRPDGPNCGAVSLHTNLFSYWQDFLVPQNLNNSYKKFTGFWMICAFLC